MVLYRLLATPIVYVAIVKIDQKQKLHVFLVFGINCWWRSMKLKLRCWKLFLWCILNAYKIDVVVYFFNMVWHFSLICSTVCVCVKCQIKMAGIFGIIAVDIGDRFFWTQYVYTIVQQSSSMLIFLYWQVAEEVSYSYWYRWYISFFIARYIMLMMIWW